MLNSPTSATPPTIIMRDTKWWAYYFLPRKAMAIPEVMTTMKPRIIWYTEAAHIVKATNMSVDPQISKAAGMARRNGLILVFRSVV